MSSTVRETALDHISTAQPVAPLPAPETGLIASAGWDSRRRPLCTWPPPE